MLQYNKAHSVSLTAFLPSRIPTRALMCSYLAGGGGVALRIMCSNALQVTPWKALGNMTTAGPPQDVGRAWQKLRALCSGMLEATTRKTLGQGCQAGLTSRTSSSCP